MPHARCNDPNCTCNSPDLKWHTNQVLKRDAARTDYIVIPLIAGVLARCVLAAQTARPHEQDTPELVAKAQEVMDLAARAGGDNSWEADTGAYGVVADLVFCNWPVAIEWCTHAYGRTTLDIGLDARPAVVLSAAVRWLSAIPAPSLTESVIMASYVSVTVENKPNELPLLSRSSRKMRVALADRLRRDHLTTWPNVLAAAVNDWTVPTLERLAFHHAAAGDKLLHAVIDIAEARDALFERQAEELTSTAEAMAEEIATRGGVLGSIPDATNGDDSEHLAAESLLEDAFTEIDRWHAERDRVQRERDQMVDRLTRARSRINSLEQELQSSRATEQRLEMDLVMLRQERDRLTEQVAGEVAAEEALTADAPPIGVDAFAGRRVLLFTGVQAADARAALAQGFWDAGADQVDCYWTDKARGPDNFPPDAIIAADLTYMGHSDWNTIQDRARTAGAWYYAGKHGAATMARATAAAWRAHRAHPGP